MADGVVSRSLLDRAQIFVTFLTAVVGIWITIGQARMKEQQDRIALRVSDIQTTQTTVESVSKYFTLLADSSANKAKMGAYAIYMLKRDDPEMVVSLVLASNRPEMQDVLVDLARRDTLIKQKLVSITSPGTDTASAPENLAKVPVVERAESVLSQVTTTGWSYLGIYRGSRWTHGPTIRIGQTLPTAGRAYSVNKPLYLREAAPDTETYQHAPVKGVMAVNDQIRIDELRTGIAGEHVWARVTVLQKPAPPPAGSAQAMN